MFGRRKPERQGRETSHDPGGAHRWSARARGRYRAAHGGFLVVSRRRRIAWQRGWASGVALALTVGIAGAPSFGASTGEGVDPTRTPGVPRDGVVVFHEDFELAPDTGGRVMLAGYVGQDGRRYTSDPYWNDNRMANGMIVSYDDTQWVAADGTGAGNGTELTARATVRQLAQAIGKVNGAANPDTNDVISAYTQSTGPAVSGNRVMAATVADFSLGHESRSRYLTFSITAAATNCRDAKHPSRENPQYTLSMSRDGVETPLTSQPIDPCTQGARVPVTALPNGSDDPVMAGTFYGDQAVLYDGDVFGITVRNVTSGHVGNDGAWDDLRVVDVTPQLDKQFSTRTAPVGHPFA